MHSTAGDHLLGNGAHGINVRGKGNTIRNNQAFANGSDGIHVDGGTAASPNVVRANVGGAPDLGNAGSGIAVGGTGSGSSDPVEVESNTTQSNGQYGIKVTGTGQQLRNNVSGGTGKSNALCSFYVGGGNINATGNTAGPEPLTGLTGSAFPMGCQ